MSFEAEKEKVRTRPAKLNKTKSDRELEREIKKRRHFILEEQHEIFVAVVRKWEMLAATKVSQKMSGKWASELKLDDISSVKRVTGKFLGVLHCSWLLSV